MSLLDRILVLERARLARGPRLVVHLHPPAISEGPTRSDRTTRMPGEPLGAFLDRAREAWTPPGPLHVDLADSDLPEYENLKRRT